MAEYDEEFEAVGSGASDTYPTECGNVKINGYMVINGRPCKIVAYSTAKTGKHGHAKASITGIDIFNGKKIEDSLPTSHNVEIPIIRRTEWQVISIDGDDYVTLMDDKGNCRSDLPCPTETEKDETLTTRLKESVEAGKEVYVTVLYAMQLEKIADMKESTG